MSVAFYLPGGVPVYTFSLVLAVGAVLGLALSVTRSPQGEAEQVFANGVWALIGALLAGRAAYVIAHWAYYRQHPGLAVQFWEGGLAGSGALVGGLLAFGLAARRALAARGEALLSLLFTLTMAALLGCWSEGVFYGAETGRWWGIPTLDEWGEVSPRLPLQLLATLLLLLAAWGLERARGEGYVPSSASMFGLGVAAVCLVLGLASLLRADPVLRWMNLPLDVYVYAGLAVLALLYAGWNWREET